MDQSDTGEMMLEVPPVTEGSSRVSRNITLPACFTSGLASVISILCIGLVSGAAGGLLLGGTAVVVLQSLELLADNSTLMDQLEKSVDHVIEGSDLLSAIQISIFAEMFGVCSSVLSLAVGIYIGLSTYSLVIKRKGEAAMGKALAVAGPVCLMGVTAAGCIIGFALESFLSITLNVVFLWVFTQIGALSLFIIIARFCINSNGPPRDFLLIFLFFVTFVVFHMVTFCLMFKTKLLLAVVFIPLKVVSLEHKKPCPLKFTTVFIQLILTIADIYDIAGQQIVALQSPTSTTTSSAVVEAIFVGVLACLMWMVTVGISLFESWQRGGAGTICAAAAGTATTVLGVIKLALPVLGPGPTIGALMGVAGAAGVSLSAAGAVIDQYQPVEDRHGLVGRLGVTVGAAAGTFLSSCAHSGLSGMFMALCAATVPAGVLLKPLLHSTAWRLFLSLWICMYIIFSIYNFIIYPQWFVLQRGEGPFELAVLADCLFYDLKFLR